MEAFDIDYDCKSLVPVSIRYFIYSRQSGHSEDLSRNESAHSLHRIRCLQGIATTLGESARQMQQFDLPSSVSFVSGVSPAPNTFYSL